jgi:DNA-binding transcriptional LysR family regulator
MLVDTQRVGYHPVAMTLQQLHDLIAVVSHGGYRAAARALDVSQAGLTKSLSRLEEEYGVTLLERTAKGILLTASGEEFVLQARAVLHEAGRAEQWLRNTRRPAATQIKVGVSLDPSLRLAPALKDFRSVFPDTTIHLSQRSASELLASIRDNRLDLAIMRIPETLDAADLNLQFLYQSSAGIVARTGHPLRRAKSVRELSASEWIVVGNPGLPGQQDDSIQELFLNQRLGRPRIAAVSDSLFGTVAMLMESDCVARLPLVVLNHPLTAGSLVEIPVREQVDLSYQIAVIFKAGRRLSREAIQLIAMLKSFSRLTKALEGK